jgi:hypothetical protein
MPDSINQAPDLAAAATLSSFASVHFDPLFWPNARLGVESAWTAHVPFAHWLVAAHRPRGIVELGTHNGVSYLAFCEAVQRVRLDCRCFAVDTWMGDEHAGYYDEAVYTDLKKVHDQRYAGFSELLRCTFDQALPYIAENSVDLLHIDGLHTYEAVRHDFESWRPKLTNRAVVVFHDTNVRENGFGVWRLWQELHEQYPGFEFYHGHGLGVLLLGDRCGPEMRDLATFPPDVAGTVRERFSFLGERWLGEMRQVADHVNVLASLQAKDRERNATMDRLMQLQRRNEQLENDAAQQQASMDTQLAASTARIAQLRGEAEAEKARLLLEERRLRAIAAQRSAQARLEAATLRVQAAELPGLREQVRELGDAYSTALQQLALARAEADQARNDAAALRRQLVQVTTQHNSLLGSTAWRMTWPMRRFANAMPQPVRKNARRTLRLTWWVLSGQLRLRLRRRKHVLNDVRKVAASRLFDPAWYVATNPDVAASGIDPALHYVLAGAHEGRDPGPGFSVTAYLERYPEAAAGGRPALLHYIETAEPQGWAPTPVPTAQTPAARALPPPPPAITTPSPPTPSPPTPSPPTPSLPAPSQQPPAAAPEPPAPTLTQLLHARWPFLEALRTYAAPHDKPRVTIVTDSVSSGSLYGGVGTALILGALLARRLGAGLRLVTRSEPAAADNIGAVLAIHGILWTDNIELLYAPTGDEGREIPIGPREVMLTTSWWTTWATRRSVGSDRIVYLLQEDERGFYPLGDDHLRCSEILTDPNLTFVINSKMLMGHLQAEGIASAGLAFDPAFPLSVYHAERREPGDKHNFFFYARPNNVRNLFWRGLEAIGAAIEEGILPIDEWAFHFAGKDIPKLRLPGGVQPTVLENLPWADYAGLVRRMDLGLSLMDTPHPSYPPLDLAASGAVVVTNRFGCKTSLDAFSTNIVCAEGTVRGLVEGLRQAKQLALDASLRSTNYAANGLQRDWQVAMQPVLDSLAERFRG